MNLARHCELCDYQEINFKNGTTCRLTNQKPTFHKTCSKIKLSNKFEDKIRNVNVEYKRIKRTEILTYVYFAVFLIIGIAVIAGGYFFGKYVYDKGVISTVPVIIMGIGLTPLWMAFGTLNRYRQDVQAAKTKKRNVDEVLSAYNIDYSIDITFGKEIHGTQEVRIDLDIKGLR